MWKKGLLITALFFLILGVWVAVTRGPVHAQLECANPFVFDGRTVCPNGSGFLWTDTYGWISMNCVNNWDDDPATLETACAEAGGAYGVFIEVNDTTLQGRIAGYGWSPTLGLVCFGPTCGGCSGIACGGRVGDTPVDATFDLLNGLTPVTSGGVTRRVAFVQGFARVEAHRNEGGDNLGGWIQLGGMTPARTPIEVGAWVNPGPRAGLLTLAGSAWQRNRDGSGVGWIYFGNPPPGGAREGRADVGSGEDVTLPPTRETDCDENGDEISDGFACCTRGIDDDLDESYTSTDARDSVGTTGVDCADYDCVGSGFCAPAENRAPDGVTSAPAQCFDDEDNDLDAFVRGRDGRLAASTVDGAGRDCADLDCRGVSNPANPLERCVAQEATAEANFCHDVDEDGVPIDNDGNEGANCEDPDCAGFVTCDADNLLAGVHPKCVPGGEFEGRCATTCAGARAGSDGDLDDDGVCDVVDNCAPPVANSDQADVNANGIGDLCDAWLQTQGGAIYAGGFRTAAPPPSGQANATFCVLASGRIVNFTAGTCALSTSPVDLRESVRQFQLLQYPDTVALLSQVSQVSQALRGRLDLRQIKPPRARDLTSLTTDAIHGALRTLSDKRFYHNGDLTIDDSIELPGDRGGVTVFVEGNINFGPQASLTYGNGTSSNLRDLTSIAWIAFGDITIDPEVQNLVGTFLASRMISTGTGNNPLTVRGLMVAKQFAFQRQYADQTRGAELIIYDGRAILNPPPGLGDIVKSLPTFRSVASP